VLGFSFGVVQMGLYALYRNATPRVPPAKEVTDDDAAADGTFKLPGEHVVTIAKLTAVPAVSPQLQEEAKPADNGTTPAAPAPAPANDVQLNAEQV